MSLYLKGMCLTVRSREQRSKKTGKDYTFYRSIIHDIESNSDPINVETGEEQLQKGQWYRIPVWVECWTPEGGQPPVQYHTYKNNPPVKIAAPGSTPPAAKQGQ